MPMSPHYMWKVAVEFISVIVVILLIPNSAQIFLRACHIRRDNVPMCWVKEDVKRALIGGK